MQLAQRVSNRTTEIIQLGHVSIYEPLSIDLIIDHSNRCSSLSISPAMEPLAKRPRPDSAAPPPAGDAGGGNGNLECRRFNTPEGCPYGPACKFRHVPADGKDVGQQSFSSAGKPKPCMKYFSTSGCPFGESCHFLHHVPGGLSSLGLAPVVSHTVTSASAPQKKVVDPGSATVNGYKTKICNRFNTAEGCKFGDRCHFAHGESDLRPSNNMPRGNNRRPIANGPLVTAPPGFSNGSSHFSNPAGYPAPAGNATSFPSQDYMQPNQHGVPGNNPRFPNPNGYPAAAPLRNASGFPYQSYPEPNQHGVPSNAGSVTYPSGPVSENVPVY